MTGQKHSPSRLKLVIAALIVVLVLAAGLAFDLANHGLAWQTMWSLTGEEQPLSQLLGMVDWLGNFTREQPTTAPDVPIQNTGVNPYGMNTFLEQEVEPAKREQQVQMIAAAGFHWIRQEIPWEDIEIAARGDFVDRRNESSVGDVSAWAKYDNIVDLVQKYGLELEVRLDHPPKWTHADPNALDRTPPDDLQDYVNFVTTFAERYKGRVHVYQIWNEPNIFPEWGNHPVDPEAYTTMLCRADAALKQIDPTNRVMSAALSPTISLTSRDLNEFIYLQRMYDAGARGCFDIMATQGYGFFSGPTDQRLRPTTTNFARSLYLRDLMVANSDADKPIWISEAAWNPVDSPEVPDMPLKDAFGSVTQDQAARYMPLAYDRAEQQMPWVGVINYWFFKRASDADKDQPYYYFRMVEPDFTPLPVYDSMKQHIAAETPTLYEGVHQADDWAIQHDPAAQSTTAPGAQFDTVLQAKTVTFTFHGTNASLRWTGADNQALTIQIDSAETSVLNASASQWQDVPIQQSMTAETHTVELSAADSFWLDSVTVYDRTSTNLTPIIGVGAALGVLALLAIGWALWKRMSS